MANNYMEFSEAIENLTPKELEWWTNEWDRVIDAYDDNPENADDDSLCQDFSVQKDEKLVWFHDDESGNPDKIGNVVQRFLKQFRPNECFWLTWASWCSKPRIGEFGGGAIFVTADEIKWHNAHTWTEQMREEWRKNQEPSNGSS
ncbi:hypothetical protein LCGC14_0220780 [marine sediment metagenome]|uniref:Uncharacterized protein n=1 Tax=marine sediment metagenome TaxID=412755 RepID=A0A0F9UDE6_9ZZZZ